MEAQYLQNSVGPILSEAIAKLFQHRIQDTNHPQDPIDFIGSYLLHHAATQAQFKKEQGHDARISDIQEALHKEKDEIADRMKFVREATVHIAQQRIEKLERIKREEEERIKLEQERLEREKQEAERLKADPNALYPLAEEDSEANDAAKADAE
jgi:hypothetical protein